MDTGRIRKKTQNVTTAVGVNIAGQIAISVYFVKINARPCQHGKSCKTGLIKNLAIYL